MIKVHMVFKQKNRILIPVVFLLLFLGFSVVHAQDASQSAASATPSPTPDVFNFEKAYKDYVFVTDQYNTAHSAYLLARSQYFQAQTLASQTKAQDATAQMLSARDVVMKAYLVALRLRLSETDGVSDTAKEGLFTRIDTDVSWWTAHHDRIDSAASLTDLTSDSDDAKRHFPTSESLSYEVLSTIPQGKEFVLRNDLTALLGRTKTQVDKIRSNGDLDTSEAERWLLQTEQKITRSQDKEIAAQALIATLTSTDVRVQNQNKNIIYNQVTSTLSESLQYLKEASNYLKEVIKRIKYKQ